MSDNSPNNGYTPRPQTLEFYATLHLKGAPFYEARYHIRGYVAGYIQGYIGQLPDYCLEYIVDRLMWAKMVNGGGGLFPKRFPCGALLFAELDQCNQIVRDFADDEFVFMQMNPLWSLSGPYKPKL